MDSDPQVTPLWTKLAPNAAGDAPADVPTLTRYEVTNPTGSAVIVCPGGGYGFLAPHEGETVARWLCSIGIAGIVLQYRLGPRYRHPTMLLDAQRAVRTVRANADAWGIDPGRVGVLGFSAGGHLAATLSNHFDLGDARNEDPVERQPCRPDAAVLAYPVITMQFGTHPGSRDNLLGPDPKEELVSLLSNEEHVTGKTPPTFIFHTVDDAAVPVTNSMAYAAALQKAQVPFALHLFESGVHGVGLAQETPGLALWPALCAAWLRRRGF